MPGSLVLAARALRDTLRGFEPGLLSGEDCAAMAEELAATEKACAAAGARAAARAAACGAHREKGFLDAADWLARTTGSSTGEAKAAIETARRSRSVPRPKRRSSQESSLWPKLERSPGPKPSAPAPRPSCSGWRGMRA